MMKLVLFPSVTITKGREIDTEWSAFAKEYLCKHTPQITKDGELYAGAVYESGNVKREDANVIGRTAVIFDFDNKDCDISQPEDHEDNLEGLTWAWHSTFSSTPDLPKFRVVIPLDRMATPQEWPVVFRGAMSLIGNDPAVDSGSADLSRAYYRPAYHPNNKGQEFSGFVDGKPLSVDEMLELGGGANVVPFSMPTTPPSPATVPIQPKNRQYDGRNDALKSQVAACMAKGKGVDATVTEVMDYDRRNHKSPLFSDPKENRGQTNSYQNALRFVTSIMGSVNTRREAQGLPPEIPGSVSPGEPHDPTKNILSIEQLLESDFSTDYLIDGWIVEGGTNQIFGESGHKKSFVALDMAMCIGAGIHWHGRDTKKGWVLYVVGEDVGGFKRRVSAWLNHHKMQMKDVDVFFRVVAVPFPDPAAVAELKTELDFLVEQQGSNPSMIVLDTKARCTSGNENDTQDANGWITCTDELMRHYRTTLLPVHHTGHMEKDRSRGAYAYLAALDAEYKVTKDITGNITIQAVKAPKNDEAPEPISFSTPRIDTPFKDRKGETLTSLVLVPEVTISMPMKLTKRSQAGLDILRRMYSDARKNLESQGIDPAGARVESKAWRTEFVKNELSDSNQNAIKAAWKRLRDELSQHGLIRQELPYVYLNV